MRRRRLVRGLEAAGADVIGSNCGTGADGMIPVARQLVETTRRPVAVQPNAGVPRARDGRVAYDDTPELMASRAAVLLDLGVGLVGGCCGTTPRHV